MDNLAFKQVLEAIEKHNNIGIAIGKDSTIDNMAAALSLYLSLSSVGKSVSIASASGPAVEVSSLVGVNKVKIGFSGDSGDLTVSFPYKEGEIDKASYTLENGYLNIIIKAGEQGLSFNEKDVKFTRSQGVPDLLFVVGTPRLTDLGPLFDPAGFKNTTVVNIDKSSENQGFGDIVVVSPGFSSVSEIMASLIRSLGLKVDQDIAQNLMQGIQNGTGNFQNPNTTPLAFEMAGLLIRSGASRQAFDQSLTSAFARSAQNQQPIESPMTSARTAQAVADKSAKPSIDWRQMLSEDNFPKVAPAQSQPAPKRQARSVQKQQVGASAEGGVEGQYQTEDQIERKENPSTGQVQNPPEDWLTPKIYKGSTNF